MEEILLLDKTRSETMKENVAVNFNQVGNQQRDSVGQT